MLSNPQSISETYFPHHEKGVSRINNGSFGSCPNVVLDAQQSWRMRCLSQPDYFYHRDLKPSLLDVRSAVAKAINCRDLDELVLIDNATTGAVIVAQAIAKAFHDGVYSKGDGLLMLDAAYGAVKKVFKRYVEYAGATIIEVKLPFPVQSETEVLQAFEEALADGSGRNPPVKCKAAVVDHITSMPAVVLPVHKIVKFLRAKGVEKIFVDSAHSVGNVPFDINMVDADFSTGNLHKWMFTPPSAAFFHFKSGSNFDLHHPITSHFLNQGLAEECSWVGTRDYSSILSIKSGIDFVENVAGGIECIMEHNRRKAHGAGIMLSEAWGTGLGAVAEMCCSMVMVGLPLEVGVKSEQDALDFRALLYDKYKIEAPIYFSPSLLSKLENGDRDMKSIAYVRISHQIYNTDDDYRRLRDAVLEICKLNDER